MPSALGLRSLVEPVPQVASRRRRADEGVAERDNRPTCLWKLATFRASLGDGIGVPDLTATRLIANGSRWPDNTLSRIFRGWRWPKA